MLAPSSISGLCMCLPALPGRLAQQDEAWWIGRLLVDTDLPLKWIDVARGGNKTGSHLRRSAKHLQLLPLSRLLWFGCRSSSRRCSSR